MGRDKWIRVGRKLRCPLCGRPDWCSLAINGTAVLCQRVESGRRIGDAGWLHRIEDHRVLPISIRNQISTVSPVRRDVDWTGFNKQLVLSLDDSNASRLSEHIRISKATLRLMEWGWSQRQSTWTVPMRSADGRIIGIRTRARSGEKRAIKSSASGLFFSPELIRSARSAEVLLICEGPTDTAALLDIGIHFVVGRPSCNSGVELIAQLVAQRCFRRVLIVSDSDTPGLRGSSILATELITRNLIDPDSIGICVPPHGIKDCRAWYCHDFQDLARTLAIKIHELQLSGIT